MARLRKRSVTLSGHETSVALEDEFWAVLERMSSAQRLSVGQLVRRLDEARGARPLASACRLAALDWALRAEPCRSDLIDALSDGIG